MSRSKIIRAAAGVVGARAWVLVLALLMGVASPGLSKAEDVSDDAMAGTRGLDLLAQAPASGADGVDDPDLNDPLEPLNRAIFNANEFVYALFLRPFAEFYTLLVPPPIQTAVGNILLNLRAPVVFANDVLQGEGERAFSTAQRFAINTTLGLGGILDPASDMGIQPHNEDFGQTMGVWGLGGEPYLVLPLLGPSSPRDAVGKHLVDGYFDPMGLYLENTDRDAARYSRIGVSGTAEYGNAMNALDQVKKTSIDYYAAIRSMYRQKRRADIANGDPDKGPPIPDINYEVSTSPSR